MTRIACAQLDVKFNDVRANRHIAIQTIRQCRADGADIVAFPECFLTGYCVKTEEQARAIAIDAISLEPLQDACNELDVIVIIGFAECSEGKLYNSAALLEPGVPTRIYRKSHLPELGFDKFATPGDALLVYETKLGRIGVLVCFDLRHPEPTRCLMLQGADLVVLPTNWPEGAFAAPEFMAAARAAENRVFFATCDRVGEENGFRFIGQSGIYDVTGRTLAKAGEDSCVISANVDLPQARMKRNIVRPGEFETTIVDSRRPELYSAITRLPG